MIRVNIKTIKRSLRLSVNKTVRFTETENETVKERAKECRLSFSDYCRTMALEGYIQAAQPVADMTEIRAFKNLLLEYKTNFSRISNKMKASDPYLNEEVKTVVYSIRCVLDRLKL